jgi:hypothetical protein
MDDVTRASKVREWRGALAAIKAVRDRLRLSIGRGQGGEVLDREVLQSEVNGLQQLADDLERELKQAAKVPWIVALLAGLQEWVRLHEPVFPEQKEGDAKVMMDPWSIRVRLSGLIGRGVPDAQLAPLRAALAKAEAWAAAYGDVDALYQRVSNYSFREEPRAELERECAVALRELERKHSITRGLLFVFDRAVDAMADALRPAPEYVPLKVVEAPRSDGGGPEAA